MDLSLNFIIEAFEMKGQDLFWKKRPAYHFKNVREHNRWNARHAGKIAGSIQKNYRTFYRIVEIDHKPYKAHRLAYFLQNGSAPEDKIDHIDGNGLNNSKENLRISFGGANARNARMCKNNSSGLGGVSWDKATKRWKSYIGGGAVPRLHIGTFENIFEAAAARISVANKYGYSARHGR